jgi:hypothetical protein
MMNNRSLSASAVLGAAIGLGLEEMPGVFRPEGNESIGGDCRAPKPGEWSGHIIPVRYGGPLGTLTVGVVRER